MNRVYVRTTKSFEFPQRHRSGLTFTKVPQEYDLTDEQLKAIKNDSFLEIIDDKRYEYEINMIKGYESQTSFKAVESQGEKMIEEPSKTEDLKEKPFKKKTKSK